MSENAWYLMQGNERVGPITFDHLCSLARKGQVRPDTHVTNTGKWFQASTVPQFAKAYAEHQHDAEVASQKEKADELRRQRDAEDLQKLAQQPPPAPAAFVSDKPVAAAAPRVVSMPRHRPRQYPATNILRVIYLVLAVMCVLVYVIGLFVMIASWVHAGASEEGFNSALLIAALPFLGIWTVWCLLPAIVLTAISESLKIMLDVQDNTHRAMHNSELLVRKD